MEGINKGIEIKKPGIEDGTEDRKKSIEEAERRVSEMFNSKMEAGGVIKVISENPYFKNTSERF